MDILFLFVFSFLIRLIHLNQSLWLDESIVARVARAIPFHLIPSQLSPGDVHPPLYYLFISAWSTLFGTSEIALRMPSILFSLIAGWYVYKMGRTLKNHSFGMWAAAFFLFNPLIIYYSQEARMHMMAAMLLSGALYYFVSIVTQVEKEIQKNDILFFNIFVIISMFTFYGSAFFIAAMIVCSVVIQMKIGIKNNNKQSKSDWIPTSVGMTKLIASMSWGLILSLIILSPLLFQQFTNAQAGLIDLKNWSKALGNVDIKNIGLIFLKFATGRLSWFPKWSYYLVAGVPTAIIWLFVGRGARKNKLFSCLFILPLIFGVIVSFWVPMMMYFRFLYLVPVMSILLALGISSPAFLRVIPMKIGIQKRNLNHIDPVSLHGMIILSIFIAFSLVYLLLSQFHREDWKSLAKNLDNRMPLYMILPSSDPISYYRNDISSFELRSIHKLSLLEEVQIIPYTADLYGVDYAALLQQKGCIKESEQHFRGDLILEKWKCLKNA